MPYPVAAVRNKNFGIGLLPFSDDFTRADGDLNNNWEYSTGTWTINTNQAVGTPALGLDLVVNGTFAADTDWGKGADWSIGGGVATRGGAASVTDLTASVAPLTVGRWYQNTYDVTRTGGNVSIRNGGAGGAVQTADGSYTVVLRCVTNGALVVRGNSFAGTVDNLITKQVTLADQFCTRDFGASSVDVRCALTVASNTMGGVVLSLDSKTSPANFLLAYVERSGSGNRLMVDKCLAGTYTNLAATTLTGGTAYGDGRVLRIVKSGVSLDLTYNGTAVGTTITLTSPTDDAIINGTRHGMFSVIGGTNRYDAFFCG